MTTDAAQNESCVRRFVGGMGYLARGVRLWQTSPRLMALGAIPALVVGLAFATATVLLALQLATLTTWLTPFADGWTEPWRGATRVLAGSAIIIGVSLLAISTFVAVTLTVGDPFYERISRQVEKRMGGAPPETGESAWRAAGRGIRSGLRLLLFSATIGVGLFALGLVPVLGQIAVPVLAALLGGWLIALELTGFTFDARGLALSDRRRMLGVRRAETLGFGVATYLMFLVPFAAVIVMPAAVAGATLMGRDVIARAAPVAPGTEAAPPVP